ncbi:MAG: hypothetical protein AVDCRST_MAG90-3180 [uncultured Microvirga sp.]|uniref:Uncharacterized protein n=1 Tax=uncultured Microvirga sp. TaxID=412392 RepID=A0A6J4MQA0_9HYPH|nr:MAG: hypothetical protein AVDCRST_MAG90-3180 [uncultured Microvirga sp.]
MNTLAKAAIVAGFGLSGTAASAADFNGRWSVSMTTDSGICEKSESYFVAIDGGRVRYVAPAGEPGPAITGSVSSSGAVDVGIQKGMARAEVVGRLQGSSGNGTWKAAGFCTGRWSAQKRGPVHAAN